MGFLISPVEKLFLVLTQEYFWKFYIFPRESGSPNRGTETGCLFCLEHLSVLKKCFGQVIPFPKSQTHVHNKASEPQETYNHIWTKQNLNRTILYFSKPYLNINTRFFQLLMKNVVSTIFLSIYKHGQNILQHFQNLPLSPDLNVTMASRLIQGQGRTPENNGSCDMSFLWGAIYVGGHFSEVVFLIRRVTFAPMGAINVR